MKDDQTDIVWSIRDNYTAKVQLVVVVQPMSRDHRYSAIKKLCCVESLYSSSIAQAQKLKSLTQEIVLQLNCKSGGEL